MKSVRSIKTWWVCIKIWAMPLNPRYIVCFDVRQGANFPTHTARQTLRSTFIFPTWWRKKKKKGLKTDEGNHKGINCKAGKCLMACHFQGEHAGWLLIGWQTLRNWDKSDFFFFKAALRVSLELTIPTNHYISSRLILSVFSISLFSVLPFLPTSVL